MQKSKSIDSATTTTTTVAATDLSLNAMEIRQQIVLKLEDVIQTKRGFKAFANFTIQELTCEHLLFLLESMQIKQEMIKYQLSFVMIFS